jgi:hypothetical protein
MDRAVNNIGFLQKILQERWNYVYSANNQPEVLTVFCILVIIFQIDFKELRNYWVQSDWDSGQHYLIISLLWLQKLWKIYRRSESLLKNEKALVF